MHPLGICFISNKKKHSKSIHNSLFRGLISSACFLLQKCSKGAYFLFVGGWETMSAVCIAPHCNNTVSEKSEWIWASSITIAIMLQVGQCSISSYWKWWSPKQCRHWSSHCSISLKTSRVGRSPFSPEIQKFVRAKQIMKSWN